MVNEKSYLCSPKERGMKNTAYHLVELSMVVLLVTIVGLHFYLYPDYFLPWYDETLFQDVTLSLLNHGTFDVTIHPLINEGRPFLMHGPVFYSMQAIMFWIFGHSDAVFDFLGIVFFVMLMVAWRINALGNGLLWALFGLICLSSDAMLSTAFHSGRMDIEAVFFGFIAFALALVPNKKMSHYFILGLSVGLAFLTTPRISVVLIPIIIFVVYFAFFFRHDTLEKLGAISAGLVALILWIIWVYWGFGGFQNYFDYFFVQRTHHLERDGNLISKFLGGNFAIKKTQYILLGTIAILSLKFIFLRANKWYQKPKFLVPLGIILMYLFFVYDTGNYSAIYIVFAYYLLIYLLQEARISDRFRNIIVVLILLNNVGIFAAKSTYLVAANSYKDQDLIENFIKRNIQPDARVLGSNVFYPALREHTDSFRMLSFQEVDKEDNIYDIIRNYRPQYVMVMPGEIDELMELEQWGLQVRLKDEFNYSNPHPTFKSIGEYLAQIGLAGSYLTDFVTDFEHAKIYQVTHN